MSVVRVSAFLRRVLLADAVITGATGLLMLLGAGFLAGLLAMPDMLLRAAGLILVPYSVLIAYAALRENLPRPAVWAVIVINVLWAVDCVVLLLSGWVAPNGLGYAFVIVQVVAVAVFAELQYLGLRQSTPLAAS